MSEHSELIAQARELLEKATPGPWELNASPSDYPRVEGGDIAGGLASVHYLKDAELIAAAPSLIDSLATALQEATQQREECERQFQAKVNEVIAAESKLAEAEGKLSRIKRTYEKWGQYGWADRSFVTKVSAILEEGGS